MIEYPRPPGPPPSKPYPTDRIFAWVVAVLLVVGKISWLVTVSRRPEFAGSLRTWWWYYVVGVLGDVLYFWILLVLARSRHWTFVATAFCAFFALYGAARIGHIGSASCAFLVLLYVLARLLKILGPRPLRREDVQIK